MDKEKAYELFREVLEEYRMSEEQVIHEYSTEGKKDREKLDQYCKEKDENMKIYLGID